MRLFYASTLAMLISFVANGQVLHLDINGERYVIDCNENECNAFSSAVILKYGLVAESLIYTDGKKFVLYKDRNGDYCINVDALSRYQDYVVKAGRAAFKMTSLLGNDSCPVNGIKLDVNDTKTALSGQNISIFISGEFKPVEWERKLSDRENARFQVHGQTFYLDPKPVDGYLEFTQVKKTDVQ